VSIAIKLLEFVRCQHNNYDIELLPITLPAEGVSSLTVTLSPIAVEAWPAIALERSLSVIAQLLTRASITFIYIYRKGVIVFDACYIHRLFKAEYVRNSFLHLF